MIKLRIEASYIRDMNIQIESFSWW